MKKIIILLGGCFLAGGLFAKDAYTGKTIQIPNNTDSWHVAEQAEALPYYRITDDIRFTKINFARVEVNKNANNYCAHVWFTVDRQPADDELFWVAISYPSNGNLSNLAIHNEQLTNIGRATASSFTFGDDIYAVRSQHHLIERISEGRYMLHLTFRSAPSMDDMQVSAGYSSKERYHQAMDFFSEIQKYYSAYDQNYKSHKP